MKNVVLLQDAEIIRMKLIDNFIIMILNMLSLKFKSLYIIYKYKQNSRIYG